MLPEALSAGPYTADLEPAGALIPYEDFFFPYLPSLAAAAALTFYLGLKGFLNIPRRLIRAYSTRILKAIETQGYTFWIIDKVVESLLFILLLLPYFALMLALVSLDKVDNLAIGAALEGILLAFATIAVMSDRSLKSIRAKYT